MTCVSALTRLRLSDCESLRIQWPHRVVQTVQLSHKFHRGHSVMLPSMPSQTRHESGRADEEAASNKTTAGFDPAPTAADCELPGDRYRIVGEIGRGGMGIVMRVVDTSLN